jgi:hypothetical protein
VESRNCTELGGNMGYYISFMFDPTKEKFDRDMLIQRFVEAGAVFIEDPGYKEGGQYYYAAYPLSFGECSRKALEKGYYADIRFSWGTDPDYLVKKLHEILDFADRLGCKLYDGQLDMWITRENIESIAEGFVKQASSIAKLFGTVDDQKYISEIKKLQQKKKDNIGGD